MEVPLCSVKNCWICLPYSNSLSVCLFMLTPHLSDQTGYLISSTITLGIEKNFSANWSRCSLPLGKRRLKAGPLRLRACDGWASILFALEYLWVMLISISSAKIVPCLWILAIQSSGWDQAAYIQVCCCSSPKAFLPIHPNTHHSGCWLLPTIKNQTL